MKTRSKGFMAALTAVIALGLFAQSSAFGIDYIITDLGNTLGGTKSEAWGINNNDEVVGRASFPGDIIYHSFLYSGGLMTDLGISNCTDPYGKSVARRINDSGQIAGESCFWVPGNFTRAFLYSGGGVMSDLGTLGGSNSLAWGINSSGHVVGSAALSGDAVGHAFVYKDGVMNDIGTLGGCCSAAYGINDSGQIVGESRYSSGALNRAFLYSVGVMTDLTPGVSCCSAAYDINNSGQVVGTTPFPGTYTHPFLYSGGVLTDLGSFGGLHPEARGEAWSINDYCQIVGWSHIPGPIPHAFLYDNDVMTDLNDLLPSGSGWELN